MSITIIKNTVFVCSPLQVFKFVHLHHRITVLFLSIHWQGTTLAHLPYEHLISAPHSRTGYAKFRNNWFWIQWQELPFFTISILSFMLYQVCSSPSYKKNLLHSIQLCKFQISEPCILFLHQANMYSQSAKYKNTIFNGIQPLTMCAPQ